MTGPKPEEEKIEESVHTRWFPDALLDLPPLEPVFGMRTPHRVMLQAMPSSRDVLQKLLKGPDFDVSVEVDGENSPLQHVPIEDVRETRLTPDLRLDWEHYYWIADGLQRDLHDFAREPFRGLAKGRTRLAIIEATFRERKRGPRCELQLLQQAWSLRDEFLETQNPGHRTPNQVLQSYVRGLSAHLTEHATSLAFVDWVSDLLQEAERRPGTLLPSVSEADFRMLGLYLQHRLFGNPWLTSPSGMIAGWHLLISSYVLAVWYAGLLVQSGYEHEMSEALFGSLWMMDQGFWRDETLLHNVLQNLNASEYTSFELSEALTTAMQQPALRA